MPTYRYEALDSTGKPVRGELEADSKEAAMAKVTGEGLFPTAVREVQFNAEGREINTGRDLRKVIAVVLVVILIALAVLGSMSRTDNASQREALPAETPDGPMPPSETP